MAFTKWFEEAFSKLGEISLPAAIMLGTLALLFAGMLLMGRRKVVWSAKLLTMASLSIALAFVLSLIRLYKMPQGGSVTPASMLPLILFSYAFGSVPGVLAGVVYGLLDFLQSAAVITNLWSFLLDYPIAFGLIGLAGLFGKMKNEKLGLGLAVACACLGRLTASVMSGVMFYAVYAEGTGMTPLVYSLWYNGSYMLPEMLICGVLAISLGQRLVRLIRS